MIHCGASGGAFPTSRSGHHSAGFRPTQLGHPVEDVTPDRNFSPLCLAVPRLQSASEHGLVSEEAVFNARLLSVARLRLPLSSPDLANPLKSRVTLRPWAVRWPRRHRGATRGNHNHDVLCTGRAELIVDRSVVVGPVRRETPDGNLDCVEKSRECGGVVPAARCEFGRHNEPLGIHPDVQLPPIPAFL